MDYGVKVKVKVRVEVRGGQIFSLEIEIMKIMETITCSSMTQRIISMLYSQLSDMGSSNRMWG